MVIGDTSSEIFHDDQHMRSGETDFGMNTPEAGQTNNGSLTRENEPEIDVDRDQLCKLTEWLFNNAPANVLIPLQSKRPLFPHMNGAWKWEDFRKWLRTTNNSLCKFYGILMRDLFCLDIDNHALCDFFRLHYPEWFEPQPVEALTSKGRHYVWRRPRDDHASALTDKARSLSPLCIPAEFLDVNGQVPIDIKSITSTGTSGVLVVTPSPGKSWVAAPWDLADELHEVPQPLLNWLESNQKKGKKISSSGKLTPDNEEAARSCWDLPMDLSLAIPLSQEIVAINLQDKDSYYYQQKNNGLYFKNGGRGARECPYGQQHDSNNFALVFRKDGAITYWCFGSACQEKYQNNAVEVGRWAGNNRNEGLGSHHADDDEYVPAPMHAVFSEAFYSKWATPIESEMKKKPHQRDYDMIARNSAVLIPYLNRFFVIVKSCKPEVVELRYRGGEDEDDTEDGYSQVYLDQNSPPPIHYEQIVAFTRRSIMQHNQLYKSKWFMQHIWYGHPDRRRVNRLVFEIDPSKVLPTDFNMFLGLKIERENDVAGTVFDESKIAPVLELLHDVWAGGDDYIYNYILNWFAYPLKNKRKTGVCLVVISEQGYGKGTIAHDLVGAGIYGESLYDTQDGCYSQITDIDDIVGRFNTQSCNRLFINADECSSFGGAYKQNNKLKSLITATSRKLEAKGLDGVNVCDFANYLLTTNNDDPVRVETSDRRFVVLDIKRDRRKPHTFFNRLHNSINDGAPLHFYKYLMARVLPKEFDPQTHRPITRAAKDMMAGQVPSALTFIQQCADMQRLFVDDGQDSMLTFNKPHKWDSAVKIKSAALYGGYAAWFDKRGSEAGKKVDIGQFSKLLIKHVDAASARGEDNSRALDLPAPDRVITSLRTAHYYID